jgi:hypothetical protein
MAVFACPFQKLGLLMARPRKALVTKERTIIMYSELWHASSRVLETGRSEPRGASWQFLASAVLTAFAFEARLCCKTRKLKGYEFFAKIRNRTQSLIRIVSVALPNSPMSLT